MVEGVQGVSLQSYIENFSSTSKSRLYASWVTIYDGEISSIKDDVHRLECTEKSTVQWMCNSTVTDIEKETCVWEYQWDDENKQSVMSHSPEHKVCEWLGETL